MFRKRFFLALLIVLMSGFLVGFQSSDSEIEITSERVGYPDAENEFSLHLHIAFSQDSQVERYSNAAREGMIEWVEANPDWAPL